MATINELARQYAERISKAIAEDGFSRGTEISASVLRASKTIRAIKSVKTEIDELTYTETIKPISETDKGKIVAGIQKELRLPTQRQMEIILEAASNDDLSDLADEIENILRGR